MIFSHGKLLLTSEYVVLDGALALAVPTKWGQEFFVEEIPDGRSLVNWTALHQQNVWLEAQFNYAEERVKTANLPAAADFILQLLQVIKKCSSSKLQASHSYSVKTNLQFPADFGLGSSSTLMANVAQWAGIDAFELNAACLGGSGYDIAVAQQGTAIIYQTKPERRIDKISFQPVFQQDLILIHLNQKQNSREGIRLYRSKIASAELISEFSAITKQVLEVQSIELFAELMQLHESKLSTFLNLETVQQKYFEDCPVFIKSLGAWGGDFILSTKFPGYKEYFQKKGFHSVFNYTDIVL